MLELHNLGSENSGKIFSFVWPNRALVRDNVSIFVAKTVQWLHAEKFKNAVQCFLLSIKKIFKLRDLDLLFWKEFEHALKLSRIKTAIDISKSSRFDRR